jgi:hypothetical protein
MLCPPVEEIFLDLPFSLLFSVWSFLCLLRLLREKEIIDSIIVRGRFCFRMETQVCDIIVRYKQDKKPVSHNCADLSDLRSRALLLINAEDREKTRQKTVKKKEDLENPDVN